MKKQKMVWFKMYFSWIQHLERLSPEECGALFLALLRYGETQKIPEPSELSEKASILFYVFQETLDRDRKEFQQRMENGSKGGRPVTEKPETEDAPEPEAASEKGKREMPPVSPELAARDIPADWDPVLKDTISEWLVYKQERGEGFRGGRHKTLLRKVGLEASKHGSQAVADLYQDAMSNNYPGVFWEKLDRRKQTRPEVEVPEYTDSGFIPD